MTKKIAINPLIKLRTESTNKLKTLSGRNIPFADESSLQVFFRYVPIP